MQTPSYSLVLIDDIESVQSALKALGLWQADESIRIVERAGEGNMNLVLRVKTNHRTVILKQSRPWVEKYPQIEAPVERVLAEIDFYGRVAAHREISDAMPRLIAASPDLHLLAMEDLGQASDYSDLYAGGQENAMPVSDATAWIANLHRLSIPEAERESVGCYALRQLNHAHIFVIPLQSPSVIPLDDICGGLEELAREVRANRQIQSVADRLGGLYLETGAHLLHGDFYPGSWLRTDSGFRVIDPEFTFAGPAEFDLAVLAAHHMMIGRSENSIQRVIDGYRQGGGGHVDEQLMNQFAAMEIIRRLIGVAQLPLTATIDQRDKMIRLAMTLMKV